MGDISPNIPENATDITVGDIVAINWGKASSKTLALTLKDLGTIYNALGSVAGVSAQDINGCCCCCSAAAIDKDEAIA